jgi:catechol 2,3-dioxygenase-like lactoylglutathione lyase family enzyme
MKLGLIMVLTPDLAEAERFYGGVLDLELKMKASDQLVFDLGETELHVFRCAESAPEQRHAASAATVCVFEVPSIEAAMRRMNDQGVVFLHETPAENPQSNIRYAAFRAPGGNVHEIMERLA